MATHGKITLKVDLVSAQEAAAAVDRAFSDLVANVPALRSTDNHNEVVRVRDALKTQLIAKPINNNKNKAEEA